MDPKASMAILIPSTGSDFKGEIEDLVFNNILAYAYNSNTSEIIIKRYK